MYSHRLIVAIGSLLSASLWYDLNSLAMLNSTLGWPPSTPHDFPHPTHWMALCTMMPTSTQRCGEDSWVLQTITVSAAFWTRGQSDVLWGVPWLSLRSGLARDYQNVPGCEWHCVGTVVSWPRTHQCSREIVTTSGLVPCYYPHMGPEPLFEEH